MPMVFAAEYELTSPDPSHLELKFLSLIPPPEQRERSDGWLPGAPNRSVDVERGRAQLFDWSD
ncbi:MAG TPA: hypothetical protein VIG90_01695, partial [Pedomonas sp.]|uniref:hypothetical protein n=1 Tax=Pedomonas sp. TaxID=2976421 RepID=UPI002F3F03D6